MITPVVQRWRARRDLYRPAGETIVTSHYEVAAIPDDRTARAFVEANHYSASYPAARFRFGLYWGGLLVGVAVFSMPMSAAVLDRLPCPRASAVELGRFVLLDPEDRDRPEMYTAPEAWGRVSEEPLRLTREGTEHVFTQRAWIEANGRCLLAHDACELESPRAVPR